MFILPVIFKGLVLVKLDEYIRDQPQAKWHLLYLSMLLLSKEAREGTTEVFPM